MKPKFSLKGLLRLIAVPCLIVLAYWAYQKNETFSLFSPAVPLSGSVPEIVHRSQPVNHADANSRLEIVVALKTRNELELNALITRQQDPASPDYQHFLSVDQYTQHYAPSQDQVDQVVKFLTTNGITVEEIYPNRMFIRASGTINQLEKAFAVKINQYQLPAAPGSVTVQGVTGTAAAAGTYFSNDSDPQVPATLQNIVQSVIGLNTLAAFKSHLLLDDQPVTAPPGQTAQPPLANPPGNAPVATPPGSAPTAKPTTPDIPPQVPLTPADIATVYNFPNANNRRAGHKIYSGRGVNLAIASAFGYDPQEVETYWKAMGVVRHGTLTDIAVDGVSKKHGDETTLDLEMAGGQAPGANILMYLSTNPMLLNFTLTFAKVVIDDKADVMTVSWGMCEDRTGTRQVATENMIFREAAVQGIAVFSSAGDDGAYDCGPKAPKPVLAVDYPSSNEYVTAVGGTSLLLKNGKRDSEIAWKKTGGGISTVVATPLWQVGPTLPPGNFRATTDVSIDADPRTGYSYYFQGKWERIGGTSASAPTWAAIWALALQATGQRIGSANYYVYRIGSLKEYHKFFYDVTQGNNGIDVGPGFKAGPNWDIPTGWGTPDASQIINWLIQVSPVRAPEDKSLGQKHPKN